MASLNLPTRPEAADCDGKNDDVPRQPASPSPRASDRERDRNQAGKTGSRQHHEGRRRKRAAAGSARRSSRSHDRDADRKALPTSGKVNKKADADHADHANASAKSSGESKQMETKMPRSSPNSRTSLGYADHSPAVPAAAPAGHGTERDTVPEHSKKSGDVAPETAPTAREPDAFGPSHLAGHTGAAEKDVERGHGFRASNSKPTPPPAEAPQYDASHVPNEAVEAAVNRGENYGTVQQGSCRRHSAALVDGVLAPSGPKGSTEKLIPLRPPTMTPSSSAILSGRYPVAGETAHAHPETLADSTESEGLPPWRGRIMKIIKNESVDGAGATNSTKHAPTLANVKSRYSGTADYQVTLRKLRMDLFANERDEPSGPSPARRILILVPLAAVMIALALVLLARKGRITRRLSSVNMHDESGVCSTEACHRVVAFAMENTDPAFDPCVDFHRHACGRWFAGSTARRSYVDENRVNFSAAAHGALTQLLLRAAPGAGDM